MNWPRSKFPLKEKTFTMSHALIAQFASFCLRLRCTQRKVIELALTEFMSKHKNTRADEFTEIPPYEP